MNKDEMPSELLERRISIRVSPRDKAFTEQGARLSRRSVSSFMVWTSIEVTKKLVTREREEPSWLDLYNEE